MQEIINQLDTDLDKALDYLHKEFVLLQIGRASSGLVENIEVVAYGSSQPLKALANISCPDVKTIQIQPWDKSIMGDIEKSISNSNLNLNPVNDGVCIRIIMPPMTEERRKDLVKLVYQEAEETKVTVRQLRHNAINKLKNLEKEKEISEDDLKKQEKDFQEKIDELNKKIDETAKNKETEVMSV